jgi:transcriptional regulator with XRE-family HTH domain
VNNQKLFGRRIRAVRKVTGLTLEKTAEKAGIDANYLGQIERGLKWPSLEIIVQVAKALSVSPATFLDFEAEESNPQLLRKKLSAMLGRTDTKELQQVLRFLKALLGA